MSQRGWCLLLMTIACSSQKPTSGPATQPTKARICTPGESACAADNLAILTCSPDGTAWCYSETCAPAGMCSAGQCLPTCSVEQKSYIGCEYFAVDLDNANVPCGSDLFGDPRNCDASAAQFAVVVSNPDPLHTAYVSVSRGPLSHVRATEACGPPPQDPNFVTAAVLPPKGLQIFNLPRRDVNGTVQDTLAYRIVSTMPITAYQFNPLENVDVYSNDATLLLPTSSLGNDYFVMTREQTFDELKGFLTVVGVDPSPTTVTVTVTARTLPGQGIPALLPGQSFTTTLKKYEVLNIETNAIGADLTGSRIIADKPIATFGGSEASDAPNTTRCNRTTGTCEFDPSIHCACDPSDPHCNPDAACTLSRLVTCCADHLEMQLFPLQAWGKDYVAVRTYPRGLEKDLWRIMAASPNTTITLEPPVTTVPLLGEGQWFEFESGEDFVIHADQPILVGQFMEGQDAPNPGHQIGDAGIGDPSFMLAVPIRQFRSSYVFLAPNKYALDYVSLAVYENDAASLDGTLLEDLPGVISKPIGSTGFWAYRAQIADGFHDLVCPKGCSVMVHGYDQYVSYGYPGGLDLGRTP